MATILVVDDEGAIRTLVSMLLKSAGHEVLAAANGLEGVALFRSFRSSIDLVITDLVMPVIDGYELVRLIRCDRPEARIICITGFGGEGCPEGTTLLRKPFLPKHLLEAVRRLLPPGPRRSSLRGPRSVRSPRSDALRRRP